MVPLLRIVSLAVLGLVMSTAARAQERPGESPNRWRVQANLSLQTIDSTETSWLAGGLGKLRRDETDSPLTFDRLLLEYRGTLTPTLFAQLDLDYTHDGAADFDLTEAYLEWRPVPSSSNRHRWRFGAFYPPLSLENRDTAWSSPYSISFSAINTWLGEEIRPFGLEWTLRRPLGGGGSAHELGVFAAAFYGNDPAGTLLFWRGWSLHDRQSRLNDRLQLPPGPVFDATGSIVGLRDNFVEPFHDIDRDPGYYAGVEWQYSQRALVQLSYYDNRADPYTFSSGEWAWDTSFIQIAFQLSLPGEIGLIGQWMQGGTYWLVGVGPDGVLRPSATLFEDLFSSYYLLLTRKIGEAHRLSLRYDEFDIVREEDPPALHADNGSAWMLAYRYEHPSGFDVAVEWLEIESTRDIWGVFYGIPAQATESQLRVQLTYKLEWPSPN